MIAVPSVHPSPAGYNGSGDSLSGGCDSVASPRRKAPGLVIHNLFPERCARMDRSGLARSRARAAYAGLANCQLCAHHCGVNRLAGERGRCCASAEARVFSAQIETADELELIPTFAIALSGCDLRCAFCITGAESWNPAAGVPLDPAAIALQAGEALESGARTVMILGGEPTVHLPAVLDLIAELPAAATLVWKTNGHASAQARALLSGMFDIWLADYKFGNDDCAQRLARVDAYTRIVREDLLWAARNSELIVRHLLMPGHVKCCWEPIARWLGEQLADVKVSLRSAFWPAWRARRHSELRALVSEAESNLAFAIAREHRLKLIP